MRCIPPGSLDGMTKITSYTPKPTGGSKSFAKTVMLAIALSFTIGAGFQYASSNGLLSALIPQSPAPLPTVVRAAATKFDRCAGAIRTDCVVDGDTFWTDGYKIRIADIDTPEISEPKCSSEAALGAKATTRLIQLLNQGPFILKAWPDRNEDQYGRQLRIVMRDGQSLGTMLVKEGLARAWTGRRQPWC